MDAGRSPSRTRAAGLSIRLRRALAVAAAGALALAAAATHAESLSRGQALYEVLGCGTASCHGANPVDNLRNVMNGAGSPSTIEYASVTRTEMNHLYATFISDQTAAQDLAAWLRSVVGTAPTPQPAPGGPTTTVVEYFHAGFGHYFVTGSATEVAALDAGTVSGWARTGRSFKAYASAGASLATVCRFFTTAFAPRSSHFYTPIANECDGLRSASRDWQYEGEAFHVPLPASSGTCPAGAKPVYRLYNGGQTGAPNHRYTTETEVRNDMVARGWVPEGIGAMGVIFCAPE
ncbi:MAG TPA: hypothetical protein VF196_01240 [Casimicrobiaceae bacterium]